MGTENDVDTTTDAKKRGRGRPAKAGGPSKREIRCSLTDLQMEWLEQVRYPHEKTLAGIVSKIVLEEISRRKKVARSLEIPAEQAGVMHVLDNFVIDEAKIRLIKIILDTKSKNDMHQKLLVATANQYVSDKRIV